MPVPIRKYRDIDLDFTAHPITGALAVLTDEDSVRRSIRNLVLTFYYERFHCPWIGSPVPNSLFSLANTITEQQIRTGVQDVIGNFEKRAEVQNVEIRFDIDRNGYDLIIIFAMKNIPEPIELVMFLRRTR